MKEADLNVTVKYKKGNRRIINLAALEKIRLLNLVMVLPETQNIY